MLVIPKAYCSADHPSEILYDDKGTGQRGFRFVHGPIFSNIVLADEINRTPPKTQAALLEAMQERQVTVAGQRHKLPDPFFVLATQNPIEQEGTYALPEAQQDRFMFKVLIDYPSPTEEFVIVERVTGAATNVNGVCTTDQLMQLQQAGILDAQKAVLIGQMSQYKPAPHDHGYTLKTALAAVQARTRTPLLVGLPHGHDATKVCLPVGAKAQLVVEGRDVMLAWGHI